MTLLPEAIRIATLKELLTNSLLPAIFASLLLTESHARTWTSADGTKTFEGELLSYDPATGGLSVKLSSGKEMKFAQNKLSDADIAYLRQQGMVDAASAPKPDSPLEGKWKLIPELTDEFEGSALDSKKWHDHNPGWLGRYPGLFSKNNVSVSGGKLHLTARVEDPKHPDKKFHTFTTAAVKSTALALYGYYEIKCRPMKSQASSAFWFYREEKDIWTEIDVFEICGAGGKWHNSYNMTVHVFRTPTEKKHWQKGTKWIPPFTMTDDYHIYALEWNKDVIKWWVDGKVVYEMKNTHWHQPLHMNFDSETFPEWFGLPEKTSLPATFSIEYIRSWKEKPPEERTPS